MKITKDGRREYCCYEMSDFCGVMRVKSYVDQKEPLVVTIDGKEWVFFYCPFCGDKIDVIKDAPDEEVA